MRSKLRCCHGIPFEKLEKHLQATLVTRSRFEADSARLKPIERYRYTDYRSFEAVDALTLA
jgi:hypothetical protein